MQLIYVHDPMCSWCWAFRPVWARVVAGLPTAVRPRRLLGGLAPDSDVPMPEATRAYVQANWRRIQEVVPGIEFNFNFWQECAPRRSTYRACRAVIAARAQDERFEEPMIYGIQRAYYLEARNPSDRDTLLAIAADIMLDADEFAADLDSPPIHAKLLQEISTANSLGARGFPSLVLLQDGTGQLVEHNYENADLILQQVASSVRVR